MSLRDFNSTDDRPISLQTEPLGNGAGLDAFHTVHPEDVEPSNTPKIVGALAVALIVGAVGVGVYSYSGSPAKPVTMASNQPAPEPVLPAAAPAPQQAADAAKAAKAATTDPNSMRAAMGKTPGAAENTPATTEPAKPMKMRAASAKPARRMEAAESASVLPGGASARMAADSGQTSQQPQQQQAVIPQPVSPTPSPSDVATTNTQSGVAVPQGAAQASDMPAPQAAPAPAQQPAPAQSAGQGNQ
jgi:hypothetical protein